MVEMDKKRNLKILFEKSTDEGYHINREITE